jgi:hypothetical protein
MGIACLGMRKWDFCKRPVLCPVLYSAQCDSISPTERFIKTGHSEVKGKKYNIG